MKKLFIAVITSLFFLSVNAQETVSLLHTGSPKKEGQTIKYGVDAGGSIARIKGEGFEDNRQLGYFFGGFVQVYVSPFVTLQGEIIYSHSGARTAINFNEIYATGNDINNNRKIHLDYVQIPLLLNIPFGYSRFRLQVGPQFSKYVGDKSIFQASAKTIRDGEVSGVCGIWYQQRALNVHVRYLVGLSDINAASPSNNWQMRTLQFGVGVTL